MYIYTFQEIWIPVFLYVSHMRDSKQKLKANFTFQLQRSEWRKWAGLTQAAPVQTRQPITGVPFVQAWNNVAKHLFVRKWRYIKDHSYNTQDMEACRLCAVPCQIFTRHSRRTYQKRQK